MTNLQDKLLIILKSNGHHALLAALCCSAATSAGAPARADTTMSNHPARVGPHAPARRAAHPRIVADEAITVDGVRNSPLSLRKSQHIGEVVTHISSADLATHHVETLQNIQNLVPNLTIQPQGATANNNFSLRGVGFKDFTSNNTPSVMTYVDGVAYPIGFMTSGLMYGLAGVDVMPGPVGYTHGQAVTAGEVNITTNGPTDTFHAGVSEDIASYARSRTALYVSGPISDRLRYRVSGYTAHGGGYQINRYDGQHLGDANEGALRGKLDWDVDSRTSINVTGHWAQDDSDTPGVFNVKDLVTPFLAPDNNNLMTGWGFRPAFTEMIGVSANTKPFRNDTTWGIDLTGRHDFGWGEFTSISAYEAMYVHNLLDLDSTNIATDDQYFTNNSNVFSQEVRLSNENRPRRFQWTIGAYYARTATKARFFYDFSGSGPSLRPYIEATSYNQDIQAFNQYATASYRLAPRWKISASVNHEADDRHLSNLETIQYGFSDVHFPTHGALTNEFGGKGEIDFQAAPNFLVFADVRKGFKPGGFTANNTVISQQLNPYKPESLLAYEGGIKSDWLNHRLRVNFDGFYYDYHDQQILSLELVQGYGLVGDFVNIPKSTIWGLEGELDANPIPGLFLEQHFGYQRGRYDDLKFLNTTAVYANYAKTGVFAPAYNSYDGYDSGIPKLTLNGSVSYVVHPTQAWDVTWQGDYSYRGSQLDVPGNEIYRLPAYFLMGMSLNVAPHHGRWSVGVYVSNLLDRRYVITKDNGYNSFYGIPGAPRFVGATIRCDF
ncbi:TonB-dependent receptor domain-containing protein [Nguyenibacter sp. L1]|uniref:TonB-dependent receptor n=1 Tax=Nguyenibacter sp. L1 TaxID=3049350 RepID=UPI002B499874|nr:TonB-dependent receptor [Nguyenibacter sp. L1]WRH86644.1 TonB-dependent receptor [Nguyenibacter sp. L1]